jgi:predicted DNA-binding transcriptional regulator AlpA
MVTVSPTKHRLRNQRPLPTPPAFTSEHALLTAAESAAFVRIGLSTFWNLVRTGRFPPPIRVMPKSPRWRLGELRAALDNLPVKPALTEKIRPGTTNKGARP